MISPSTSLATLPQSVFLMDTLADVARLMVGAEGLPPVGLLGEVLLKNDEDQVIGILCPWHLLRAWVEGLKLDHHRVVDLLQLDSSPLLDSSRFPVLDGQDSLSRPDIGPALISAQLMLEKQWGIVPILAANGQVQGSFTPFYLLQTLQATELLKLFSLAAVAVPAIPVLAADPAASPSVMATAMAAKMVESQHRWLIVTEPEQPHQARAIWSDRQVLAYWVDPTALVLSPAPIILKPSQGAATAYTELAQQGRSALCFPTQGSPHLVSIISLLQVLDRRRLFLALQSSQRLVTRIQSEQNLQPHKPSKGAMLASSTPPAVSPEPELEDDLTVPLHPELLKRKWAEEALRKSEQLRQIMLSHVPAVIWIVDEDLNYTHIAGGDPVNFGLSESLVGHHISDLDLNDLLPPQRFSPSTVTPSPIPPEAAKPANALLQQAESHRQALQGERVTYEITSRGQTYECRLDPLPNGKGVIGIAVNITARKQAEAKMAYLAHYDALTQLPNRLVFQSYLRMVLEQAQAEGFRVGVMFMDLDSFKNINDTLGHTMGDRLLQEVARRIKTCVRSNDLIARMGGDEFTFVLANLDQGEEATQVAERILATLHQPILLDHHTLHISGSIGISIFPQDGNDVDSLVRRADAAMYRAKSQGHGCVERYQPSQESNTLERLLLQNQLRQALDQEEGLLLYFQPLIDLHTGQMTAAEALLRWRTPQGDCLSPDMMVKAAEDSGLIGSLGQRVLWQACTHGREWLEQGSQTTPIRIAINLSFRQFIQRDLVPQIADILRQTGFPASHLELQLTESVAIQDMDWVIQSLLQLHDMGIQLALDNFGKGHASLLYMRELPLHQLRIDRGFIENLENANAVGRDQALVKAMIEMGHSLGLLISANGVERRGQLQVLQQLGCDQAQGHYFSPPLSQENFSQLILDPAPHNFLLNQD
ncbi:MAG: EAL domain-containing protein [Synechococcaceae cyanobacterium SM2_3_2]|nr:EAL domain-containing protein [Synechococcaceae cyanobacterium SM2_3_2]